MGAIYKLDAIVYKVTKCTLDDIDTHYELVRSAADDVPEDVYKSRMTTSVEQGLAYYVKKDGVLVGFLYNICNDKRYGEAVSIWGVDPIAFITLLKESFTDFPSHKIRVMPHKNNVTYISSLVKGDSIRNWHLYGTPLVVVIAPLIEKFKKMYMQLGITKVNNNV